MKESRRFCVCMDSVHAQRVVAEFIPRAVYVQQQFRFRKHRLIVRARNQQGEHRMEITGSFASAAGVWSLQTIVSPSLSAVAPTVT